MIMLRTRSALLLCLISFVLVCRAAPGGRGPPPPPPPEDDKDLSFGFGFGASSDDDNEVEADSYAGNGEFDDNEGGYGDEDDEYEEYDDDDYEGDYDAEEDGDYMESPEEMLAELADEHYETEQDCKYLKGLIDQAKNASSSTPVDPELQEAYTECRQYLTQLGQEIQQVSAQLDASNEIDS